MAMVDSMVKSASSGVFLEYSSSSLGRYWRNAGAPEYDWASVAKCFWFHACSQAMAISLMGRPRSMLPAWWTGMVSQRRPLAVLIRLRLRQSRSVYWTSSKKTKTSDFWIR